jgi:hypothetical protein
MSMSVGCSLPATTRKESEFASKSCRSVYMLASVPATLACLGRLARVGR